MLKPLDLYAHEQTAPLAPFGNTTIKYEFRKYNDVRNLGSALAYMLVCTQRVVVAGAMAYEGGPIFQTEYDNYPAIIVNQIVPTPNNGATAVVKTMFPRTLNTAVTTSVNTGTSTSSGTEYQHTSGSSTSNTNTFSLITLGFEHGKDKDISKSKTRGETTGAESSSSSGDEMSIKDWSSYGYLAGNTITWLWGQTYPWDVLQYNQGTDNGDGTSTITIPGFVQARLLDGTLVLPPSSLSLYGCDFTMKAGWLIEFPNGISGPETISLQHNMICYHASHSYNGDQIVVTLQNLDQKPKSTQSVSIAVSDLDMSTYALDPITNPSARNGAIIGFTSSDFTYGPKSSGKFKVVSPANNLQVTGSGFDPGLTTTFQPNQTPSLSVKFKITDSVSAYSLLLKHWVGCSNQPCLMTFTINNMQTVKIYVEATEGMGAQNNLSVIELRNLNFASINFHDYLVIGLNTIDIAIDPVDPNASNQYTLFALAVGRA